MKNRTIIRRMLYPTPKVGLTVSVISYMALIFIFAYGQTKSTLAYLVYCMSAYSLIILCAAMPKKIRSAVQFLRNHKTTKRLLSSHIVNRYLSDLTFRGNIGIYQGMAVNFFYTIFRTIMGIRYASVWFISLAVYYLFLGVIRAYLIVCYKQRFTKAETICYRNTAWFLFLLNIPMGGMIALMIRTDSGFLYPGYVIYLSALYTFYTLIISVRNIAKYHKAGSPILTASKILNFIAALMSILGLQTAMISQFSTNGERYRKMMNGITGSFVYAMVIVIAIWMLFYSRKKRGATKHNE